MFELGLTYKCPRLCSLSYCGSWGCGREIYWRYLIAGFKALLSLWKDYNLVNEEIGYVNENFLVMNSGLHYCCSVGLLQILVTTRVAIPPHLLVVPHTE